MSQSQHLGGNMQAGGDIYKEMMSQIGKATTAFK